ncbi:DUF3768 domain-containing protein [Sphingomonas panacisoli]|uniref:DUF3768 domain-containing protein n=1 Tax=Sphingomonas panacisoli TaxID=1813879 RepID=A0A5B8LFF9_9SPHN|nr:DUF3768 domain-containing protein [Sphingomonas panacisoli]QDZ06392.1 DUF3768 domain-containing protein [Sphingomonas panacisoli]
MTAIAESCPEGMSKAKTHAARVAKLNDDFRQGRTRGRFFVTPGIIKLSKGAPDELLSLVRNYNTFTRDENPYGENDFGSLDWRGSKVFWKIDYYNLDLTGGSPDPTDDSVTVRCLVLMLAAEY